MSWFRMFATVFVLLMAGSFIPSTSRAASVDEIALWVEYFENNFMR